MKKNIPAVVDNLMLKTLAVIWRVAKKVDPRPLQEHFAAREAANSIKIEEVFNAHREDSGLSIVRVCNNLILSEGNPKGLFKRNSLVKVYNPENQHFAVLYVMGAGQNGIARNAISLDYDARVALGISKQCKGEGLVDLRIGKANLGDTEFFHMYTDHDKSSRSARLLGWVLFAYGLVWSAIGIVESAIAGAAVLIGLM